MVVAVAEDVAGNNHGSREQVRVAALKRAEQTLAGGGRQVPVQYAGVEGRLAETGHGFLTGGGFGYTGTGRFKYGGNHVPDVFVVIDDEDLAAEGLPVHSYNSKTGWSPRFASLESGCPGDGILYL